MPPPSKKQIERFYLDAFASHCPSFPKGDVQETEEPDFLVETGSRTIGIELTELHREPPIGAIPQQAREAMRHRVVARAQMLYESEGLPPVRCAVHMRDQHIGKDEVDCLANAIAGIARRNLLGPNSSGLEEFEWTNREYFPEIVLTVSVHRHDAITKSHFFCPGATCVAPLTNEDLLRALSAKESKYQVYRRRCDEAWLLINTDMTAMSTWFQFDAKLACNRIESNFDRVFVFRHFGASVYELALSHTGAA